MIDKLCKGKFSATFFTTYKNDSLLNPLTYFKLISHSLGHADWDHLYSNFIKILLIGPLIEEKYGSINLLIAMILTSLIIGIVNKVFGKGGYIRSKWSSLHVNSTKLFCKYGKWKNSNYFNFNYFILCRR